MTASTDGVPTPGSKRRWFAAIHRDVFTLTPRLCRYPQGWSLWWLWFEVARIARTGART